MNAVIEGMYEEILETLAGVREDDTIRCLVITGSALERDGVRKEAFCAGADLKEHASGSRTAADRRRYIQLAHETCGAIAGLPKPVVAAVNGPARGAGTELALCCDLVVMAEGATMAFPEVGLGTMVGGGLTQILPSLVGLARARELILTGRVIDGNEAVALGLSARVVPLERLTEEVHGLARNLASNAPLAMAVAKRLLQRSSRLDLETVLTLETDAILGLMETDDWREGAAAFAEKRQPIYRGQ
jgi:enoyl-CoA hydratase